MAIIISILVYLFSVKISKIMFKSFESDNKSVIKLSSNLCYIQVVNTAYIISFLVILFIENVILPIIYFFFK